MGNRKYITKEYKMYNFGRLVRHFEHHFLQLYEIIFRVISKIEDGIYDDSATTL